MSIFVNFNSGLVGTGTDAFTGQSNGTPDSMLGFRLACRALLGVGADQCNVPQNLKCFRIISVMCAIATRLRKLHQANDQATVVIYLHIDEIQLAHQQLVGTLSAPAPYDSEKLRFVKDMLHQLGNFRVFSLKYNIFVVPLISGTTDRGVELELTQFTSQRLLLGPLSHNSAKQLFAYQVRSSSNKHSVSAELAASKSYNQLIASIGGHPRILEDLALRVPSIRPEMWSNPLQANNCLSYLAFILSSEVINSYAIPLGDYVDAILQGRPDNVNIWHYFEHIINATPTSYGALIGTHTVRDLAETGLVFVRDVESSEFPIFLPQVLLSRLCEVLSSRISRSAYCGYDSLTLVLLSRLAAFPPLEWTCSGQSFELITLGLFVLRIRLRYRITKAEYPSIKAPFCSLAQLLPGTVPGSEVYAREDFYLPKNAWLFTESSQFLSRKYNPKSDQKCVSVDGVNRGVSLCTELDCIEYFSTNHPNQKEQFDGSVVLQTAIGTYLVDGRHILHSTKDHSPPLILMFQMKVSAADTTIDSEADLWFYHCARLRLAYPNFRVLPVRITNREVLRKEHIPTRAVLIDGSGIKLYAGFLNHWLKYSEISVRQVATRLLDASKNKPPRQRTTNLNPETKENVTLKSGQLLAELSIFERKRELATLGLSTNGTKEKLGSRLLKADQPDSTTTTATPSPEEGEEDDRVAGRKQSQQGTAATHTKIKQRSKTAVARGRAKDPTRVKRPRTKATTTTTPSPAEEEEWVAGRKQPQQGTAATHTKIKQRSKTAVARGRAKDPTRVKRPRTEAATTTTTTTATPSPEEGEEDDRVAGRKQPQQDTAAMDTKNRKSRRRKVKSDPSGEKCDEAYLVH
eukprot:TRINITY_DN1471_c0_g1_i2.p1 TRINITY_DN1471_c0_g1~~TRINITY_DN1471_c0_g1_i2.p1  ORF type:complete len:858 (-),score=81.05 TRINITY_DN1471_c0_g1_i2:17-2590(-)